MIQSDISIREEAAQGRARYEQGKHGGHKAEMHSSGYPNGWHAKYSAIAGNPNATQADIKDAAAAQYQGLHQTLGTSRASGHKGVIGI